jgi:hypothetical protein
MSSIGTIEKYLTMHFEEVWAEAEMTSAKINSKKLEDVVKAIHHKVDNITKYVNLPREQTINIGEILFDLANVVNIIEVENKIPVNVSAGLKFATKNKQEDLLDPEIADDEEPDIDPDPTVLG